MRSFSDAGQETFAFQVSGKKRNGYFLEIGANHPCAQSNNTYYLEKDYDWFGLSLEICREYEELAQRTRRSPYLVCDATKADYTELFSKYNLPKHINYLQIDLDVENRSTLEVLELLDRTVMEKGYIFGAVTMEHDFYREDYFNTRTISRNIFSKRGYVLVFPNISLFYKGSECIFEDWYVHPDAMGISRETLELWIKKFGDNKSMNFNNVLNIINS